MRSVTFWACSLSASYYVLGWLDDEEPETATSAQRGTTSNSVLTQQLESLGERDETHSVEGEEDVEDVVPDTLPDDAWFIPLGWAHQCPQTYYKRSDPEWQSYLDFARDQRRNELVKGVLVCQTTAMSY